MSALKKLFYILLILIVGVQIYILTQEKEREAEGEKKRVVVSSFALYDVASHLSGGSVDVINILPLGVDPHSFEPTPKLMAEIEKSDLLLFSGAGLEPWTDGISFKNRVIDVSRHVELLEFAEGEHHEHEHHDEHKEDDEHHDHEEHEEHHEHKHQQCDHSGIDPHY